MRNRNLSRKLVFFFILHFEEIRKIKLIERVRYLFKKSTPYPRQRRTVFASEKSCGFNSLKLLRSSAPVWAGASASKWSGLYRQGGRVLVSSLYAGRLIGEKARGW